MLNLGPVVECFAVNSPSPRSPSFRAIIVPAAPSARHELEQNNKKKKTTAKNIKQWSPSKKICNVILFLTKMTEKCPQKQILDAVYVNGLLLIIFKLIKIIDYYR
jgi:hypothetical protein